MEPPLASVAEKYLTKPEGNTHSVTELITASVHANKRGDAWVKYLGKLEKSASTKEGKTQLSEALERIDRQLKADPSIMSTMDPKLAMDLMVKVYKAASIVDPRAVRTGGSGRK